MSTMTANAPDSSFQRKLESNLIALRVDVAVTPPGFVRLRRPSHFLLNGQEKVTKEKATRVARPPLRCGCASDCRGLSTARPCTDDKLAPIHGRAPTGLSASPPPRHTGPEIKCRATSARGEASASAVASARWSARFFVGPLRRGEAGTIGPQGRAQEVRAFVVSTWMYCRQTPAPTHAPFGQGCPKGAAPGWPSLWLLSLGHSRESDSGARRRTKHAMDGARVTAWKEKPRSKWIPAFAGMTNNRVHA